LPGPQRPDRPAARQRGRAGGRARRPGRAAGRGAAHLRAGARPAGGAGRVCRALRGVRVARAARAREGHLPQARAVMKVLASYSIKGGVGKTSAAVNLAALAAGEGRRTLIWDLDPQGAATFLFRVRPKVKGGGAKLVGGKRDPLSVIKGTDIQGL